MGLITKDSNDIIIACDVKDIDTLEKLVYSTCDLDGVGGYKVGALLGLKFGLGNIVEKVGKACPLPVIYDHQKAMTDIPELGSDFVEIVKESGVKAMIGFPQAGPATEEAWINACKSKGLEVIIGGAMTHSKYLASEGGYISDSAVDGMYLLAKQLSVNNFVVPGNKPELIEHFLNILKGTRNLSFFAPGYIAQGGKIQQLEISNFHPIVGRAIYESADFRSATKRIIDGFNGKQE